MKNDKYEELSKKLEQSGFKFKKIGRRKYEGEWRKSLGSGLFFEVQVNYDEKIYVNYNLNWYETGFSNHSFYIKKYSNEEKFFNAVLITKIG